jgi:DNA-binding NarL/FixJ family response regulator
LGISEKTVEKHLDGIFTKLGVNSRVEAAVRAVRDALV